MSEVKWTKEQRQVIESRNTNLLVSAAAGSGKTAVLIERIIELVLDEKNPIDINKLLVVTFTKLAASEMRERVSKAIEKKLEENPENEHLQKQLLLLSGADITTIDSFCKDVLISYAHLVNLDSNIKVIDPSENEVLAKEVMEELFEELYENNDESFLRLVNWYAKKNTDEGLLQLLLNVNNFVDSHPFPNIWLNEKAEFFNTNTKDGDFYLENYILDIAKDVDMDLEFFELSIKNNLKKIENYPELEKYIDIYNTLLDALSVVKESLKNFLKDNTKFDELKKSSYEFLNSNFGSFRISKCDEEVKEIYNKVKKELDSIKSEISESLKTLNLDIENIKRESDLIYPYVRSISDVVIKFKEKFWERKQKFNYVDFADIEHLALEILVDIDEDGNIRPSKTALEYQEKYSEVFIDEYQDSNLVQEILLSAVAKENNRFMVGDVKQSIYRFRQADPSIFMEKYENYYRVEEDIESFNRKIMLYANFRSRKEILEGTNLVFSKIMKKETGELDYTVDERLNPMASFKESDENVGGAVEILLVDEKSDEEYEDEIILTDEYSEDFEEMKSFKLECIKIANTIYNMMNNKENPFKVYDKNLDDYRKVEYKDIAILMRSPSSNTKILEEVFLEYNIPIYAESTGGYFDTFEVDTIINLLKIIDNPMQDIPLISVMYSPIYNFTSKELSEIRLVDRELKFYELLMKILEDEDIEIRISLKEKISKFISDLKLFIQKKSLVSADELIWFLYKYTGYYNYVGLLDMGEQRKTNLMLLFEKAKNYEKNSYKGLFNFVNYIQKISLKSDISEAKLISEDANVVRIMSIHKSKGLEFPIVFLANTNKKFNFRADDSNLVLHQKLGFGAVVYDMDKKTSFNSIMKKKIEKFKKNEQIAEEMRLLYVAMTRAKEKLIITGRVKDYENLREEISSGIDEIGNISNYKILKINNYLDWILSSIDNLTVYGKSLNCLGREENFLGNEDLKFQLNVNTKTEEFIEYQRIKDEIKTNEIISDEDDIEVKQEMRTVKEFLEDRFNKEYVYKNVLNKPSSITVSEIKKMIQEEDEEKHQKYYKENFVLKTPSFIHQGEEKVGFNSAEKGTIFHLAMQLLDFSKFDTEDVSKIREEVKLQINSFVEKNIMSLDEAETININWIVKFIQSDIFKEIYIANKSEKLFKEKAIDYNIKLKNLFKDENIEEDEKIMVVGIIDLFFENENGEIILLDYKTDYVTKENLEEVKARYKVQLDLYKSAIEDISGKKVTKKGLYLFGINEFVEI
ncbi:helicase-exonuclease AddAB subunit AddA [Parvimonas micra]|uniref:ATP-dependent helicase/nuclease subunit A n=1 Tax=Parvimonas micra TaxID=33033 RepID=A0A930H5M9_9FIRM|nr:helicase-exonuclease AddAB subunit AddA [Parvimonas micra]MBF1307509.1 helicase-exonuclease AddAB subunit AddA [Parvimonas micra]WBB31952.1 helicase-exonuclease AddAB subunit AddA [Parvimonas micra]WBB33440.1 helicase-exonuclease AddAB subunit AddA [Parvimonas micra]WBB34961.1 helicase-exonuclease AddAB subunit AddA [Parvimonas micra]